MLYLLNSWSSFILLIGFTDMNISSFCKSNVVTQFIGLDVHKNSLSNQIVFASSAPPTKMFCFLPNFQPLRIGMDQLLLFPFDDHLAPFPLFFFSTVSIFPQRIVFASFSLSLIMTSCRPIASTTLSFILSPSHITLILFSSHISVSQD